MRPVAHEPPQHFIGWDRFYTDRSSAEMRNWKVIKQEGGESRSFAAIKRLYDEDASSSSISIVVN